MLWKDKLFIVFMALAVIGFSRLLYPAGSTSILSRLQVMIMISSSFKYFSYYFIKPARFRKILWQ